MLLRQVIRGTDREPTETGCKEQINTPRPAPEVYCGRTHVGYRTRDSLWRQTQTEHYHQLREPLAEGNNRHTFPCKQFQKAGRLHIKSSVAIHNTVTKTEKREPPPQKKARPSAGICWLYPLALLAGLLYPLVLLAGLLYPLALLAGLLSNRLGVES